MWYPPSQAEATSSPPSADPVMFNAHPASTPPTAPPPPTSRYLRGISGSGTAAGLSLVAAFTIQQPMSKSRRFAQLAAFRVRIL